MQERDVKKEIDSQHKQEGAIGYILAWLLGIPIPILLSDLPAAGLHLSHGLEAVGKFFRRPFLFYRRRLPAWPMNSSNPVKESTK